MKITQNCGTYCATSTPAERHFQLSPDILFLYMCVYQKYQKYVYQPTVESLSQPAVTWHIISHIRKDGPPIETAEITKCPCGKR